MLIDPMVLKKKLNKMATEPGAFAVLSSLLLYIIDLAACDPQMPRKKAKWAEGKENKMIRNPACQRANIKHPTRFELLQSKFMNNNREPHIKKTREVGKLIIKEKQWMSRSCLNATVNKLDRNKEKKGSDVAPDENEKVTPNERGTWNSVIGKNTVKNILKKFLDAEEKANKEKTSVGKKKEPNSNLPKIISKNSVLSKLKEKFEQAGSVCSVPEVKKLLSHKGEKNNTRVPNRQPIHKAEVRELRIVVVSATALNNPRPQYLVCTTAPMPRFSVVTEISHPWSWLTNNIDSNQPFDHGNQMEERSDSDNKHDIKTGKNEMPENMAQDREYKEQIHTVQCAMPKVMTDDKDSVETKIDSINHGTDFLPNLDSSCTFCKNKALTGCIPTLSKASQHHKGNSTLGGFDISASGDTKAVQHASKNNPSTNLSYSDIADVSSAHSLQDIRGVENPKITVNVCYPKETEMEFSASEKDPTLASHKCFPEEKLLQSIQPFCSPVVQASHNVAPPNDDLQLIVKIPVTDKMSPLMPRQENTTDSKGKHSAAAVRKEKFHYKQEIFPSSRKKYCKGTSKQEEEPTISPHKLSEHQMQTEQIIQELQLHQKLSPQNNIDNFSANVSNPTVNLANNVHSSNGSEKEKNSTVEDQHICFEFEKHQSPLSGYLEKHGYIPEENFGKDQLSSSLETASHENNTARERSTLCHLKTYQMPSKFSVKHGSDIANENLWSNPEMCQSFSSNYLTKHKSNTAEQRMCHVTENLQYPSSQDLVKDENYIVKDKKACHNSDKHQLPSSNESVKNEDDIIAKNVMHNCENYQTSPPSSTDVTSQENHAAKEKNILHISEKNQLLSPKEVGNHENNTAEEMNNFEKSQLLSSNTLVNSKNNSTVSKTSFHDWEKYRLPFPKVSEEHENKTAVKTRPSSNVKPDQLPTSNDTLNYENDMRHENFEKKEFPSSNEMEMQGNNSASQRRNIYKCEEDKIVSSDEGLTHEHDKMEEKNDTAAGNNTSCNSEMCFIPAWGDFVKYGDSNAKDRDSYSFETCQLPPSKNKTNTPGLRNNLCNIKYQMPSSELVKCEYDATEDENTYCNTEKYQLFSSNKSVKGENNAAVARNVKSNFKNFQKPSSRNSRNHESKTVQERNTHYNFEDYQSLLRSVPQKSGKKTTVERETLYDPKKNKKTSSSSLVKHEDNVTVEKQQQTPPADDFLKHETKSVQEKNKHHSSEKYKLTSSNKLDMHGRNTIAEKKQQIPTASDFKTHESCTAEKKSAHYKTEKKQLPASSKSDKHEATRGRKKNNLPDFEKFQASLSSDLMKHQSNSVLEENTWHNTDNCQKLPLSKDASTHDKNPAEQRKTQPGFDKYCKLSSNDLAKYENAAKGKARRLGDDQTNDRKAELQDCTGTIAQAKYIAESYSERPLHSSFKPMIIRVSDTFKHHT